MILVDTNVMSEPLRRFPDPRVGDWLDAQTLETLYLSAISVAELRFGVRALPSGRRRNGLHDCITGDDAPGTALLLYKVEVRTWTIQKPRMLCRVS